jgi:hypothetical protein
MAQGAKGKKRPGRQSIQGQQGRQGQEGPQAPAYQKKPTAAVLLFIIGGIVIFIVAALYLYSASVVSSLNTTAISRYAGNASINATTLSVIRSSISSLELLAFISLVSGLVLATCGILLYLNPARSRMLGIVGVVFSLLSLTTLGGLVVGFILAIIGSILALRYSP